jgi:hypothetical protein
MARFHPDMMLLANPGPQGATAAVLQTMMMDMEKHGDNIVQIYLNDEMSIHNVIARLVRVYGEELVKERLQNTSLTVVSFPERIDAGELTTSMVEKFSGKRFMIYLDVPNHTRLIVGHREQQFEIVKLPELERFLSLINGRIRMAVMKNAPRYDVG